MADKPAVGDPYHNEMRKTRKWGGSETMRGMNDSWDTGSSQTSTFITVYVKYVVNFLFESLFTGWAGEAICIIAYKFIFVN